ncbi:MAG: choice-of-anchor D domain-containing protein [Candidatus Acidiferrales bacterium]
MTPSSVNFSNVPVGTQNSQTIKLSNTGTQTLVINSANVSGNGFSVGGISTPLSISPGKSSTFNVNFKPQTAGALSGDVVLSTTASNEPSATVPLSGVGVSSTALLTSTANSLNFNSVPVGSSSQQTVTLINSGNTNVNINAISLTGNDFTKGGTAAPVTLTPSQMADVIVTFTPSGSATFTGNITVASNAPGLTITLTGSGASGNAHSAILNWTASTTNTVTGYNVYRGPVSGGPYTILSSSPVNAETFTDLSVAAGQTYFYVVTAVDASGMESIFSSEVSGTIPTP